MRETIDIRDVSKRTLGAALPGAMVRELLSISTDLIQQWFSIKRVPRIHSASTQDKPDANAYSVGWKEALRKMYACVSQKCKAELKIQNSKC